MTKEKVSVRFMCLGILFCVCLIISNLLEVKVMQFAGVTLTGGLLIFPVSYIINDCVSEVWGYKKARIVIWSGFGANLLLILFTSAAVHLPSAPFWEGSDHFNYVFGFVPRILIASVCAFLVGSFLNAYIICKMKVLQKGRGFSLRAILSTVVGEAADSAIYFPLAFGGLMGAKDLFGIALVQVLLKSLYEVVALPITVSVVKRLKKSEGIDHFEENI